MSAPSRPASVTVAAVALLLLAGCSALGGIALTAVSGCCGSSEGSDGRWALGGLLLAAVVLAAAVGMLSGQLRRVTVLALTAAFPAMCIAAAPWSLDLGALAPFALAGWLLLWWLLRRPAPAAWTGSRRLNPG